MKNYFLILLSVVGIGILIDNVNSSTPTPTTAVSSEMVVIEEIPTLSKIDAISIGDLQEISTTAKVATVSTAKKTTYTYAATKIPSYSVTVHTDTIKSKNLSYNDLYKTKNLIFGHNSANLLGNLKNLGIGSTFTVTENGITSTYQIADIRIFYKSDDYSLELCTSGYDNCDGGTYYLNSLQYATFRGKTYDVALFTCDGASLGGGDATHRRVVFAYKI